MNDETASNLPSDGKPIDFDRAAAPPTEPANTQPAREVAFDTDGRISENLHCRGCGYNLRGLRAEGACPECDVSIALSIREGLLRYADPDWLERLARGALTVLVSYIAITVVSMFGGFASMLLMNFGPRAFRFALGVLTIISVAISLVIVLGVWWLTTPEPAMRDRETGLTARRIARYGVLAMAVAAPLQLFMQDPTMMMPAAGGGAGGAGGGGGGPVFAFMSGPWWYLTMGVGMLASLCSSAGTIAGLLYLSRLARRVPQPSIEKQTRTVMWGYGITLVFGTLLGAIVMVVFPTMLPGLAGSGAAAGGAPTPMAFRGIIVFGIAGCGLGLGSLVFGIWALVLLGLYRGLFRKAAEQSRRELAAMTGGDAGGMIPRPA